MSDPTTIPPFPTSTLPTATIHTIDFDLLSRDDPEQSALVHSAATGYGFFYLTNHHVDHEFMFSLAQKVFDLPLPEKMKYDMGSTGHYYGYKRSGGFVVDDKGTPDHSEFYNISKDEVLGINNDNTTTTTKSTPHPAVVTDDFPQLAQYIRSCHAIVSVVVRTLGRSLGLPPDLLPSLHRIDRPSCCQARVTHAPPIPSSTVALGEHSDFGSVTVLFNRLGGLQVLNPDYHESTDPNREPEWKYVIPRPECAIINLGDALVKLCGNRLYSAVHRVLGPPGEQAQRQRHSVVYFARPNSDVLPARPVRRPRGHGEDGRGRGWG